MMFKRLALGCSTLALVSGCSHLLHAPAQYTSLPVIDAAPVASSPVLDQPDVTLPAVVIPGQLLDATPRPRVDAVEPYVALRQSERARLAWRELRPEDLLRPAQIANTRPKAADSPNATGSVPRSDEVPPIPTGPEDQNPEKALNKLQGGGEQPTSAQCGSC